MDKIKKMWGGGSDFTVLFGYSSVQKGGSALGLSPKSPRGGLRQGKEVTPYGC